MNKRLRIAQIAPLIERVPPKKYGGTERVVYHLTEGLVARGHEVTLFASGDSQTTARLVAPVTEAIRLGRRVHSPEIMTMLMLQQVYGRMLKEFDIVHSHLEFMTFPFAAVSDVPTVFTMHGRLDSADYQKILRSYRHLAFVSISDAQRRPIPDINWAGTIYHGYPPSSYDFNDAPDDYFLFLGRFSPEKRADQAIMMARACGIPLKIAAKIDPADREYFEARIRPLLNHPLIDYVGEVDETHKRYLLKNAKALLNTIDWPEPFGLVMIEALGSGTPVIVRRCGSAPEVVADCETGFLCESRMDFINAIRNIGRISRRHCRDEFLRRFSDSSMVGSYESLYYDLLRQRFFENKINEAERIPPSSETISRLAGSAEIK
ncbi:glycosyltransferase family 4 protein [Chlorobium phaeovibrioides]|uniref:Glycosyltransferase n=1 Tax=Chlorobium phaeovibrioides TaxID=1094 RepID=A0ABW9UNP6_CHLPH|nr:glycosyltransferase family 4 protein [Chlorobium phaeovibrioides]MWV53783.1 glycosyltransferase [Chlorobium phaeovibrioides]